MNFIIASIIILLITYTLISVKLFNKLFKIQTNNFEFSSIEGLRGFLALFVFIHHFFIWYNYIQTGNWDEPASNLINHFGKSGVSFFFMITGFLFTNKLMDSKTIDWKKFYINRIIRLVPLYVFSTLCLILIILILSHFHLNDPLSTFIGGAAQWLAFTYVGSGDLNTIKDTLVINAGVVWTLAHEWFFYFTLPIIGFVFFRKKASIITILVCVLFIAIFILKGDPLYFHLLYFLAGALSSFVVLKLKSQKEIFTGHVLTLLIIALVALNVYFFHSPENLISMLMNLIIFISIAGGNSFFGLLRLNASQIMGQLSYGMYILHGVILFVFNSFIFKKEFLQKLSLNEYFYLSFLYITAVILVTFLTNRFIEKPFARLRLKD